MRKEYTCIVCPNGCDISVELNGEKIVSIEGALCRKGKEYVTLEQTDPQRTISSSVLVFGGEIPLASVRLTNPVPKSRIFDVMKEIRKISIIAPAAAGQIVIKNVLELNSDVIVTKNIERVPDNRNN